MVFPGHFSTGCSRCRQRKVKCDETKPSCRRCYIYGQPCPGYTDQFHFRYTRKKDFERVSTAAPPAPRRDSQASVRSDASSERAIDVFQAPIIPPPTTSYEDVSLCYFVRRFVSPDGPDGFPGHLTFLPCLYDSQNPGLLEMATLSVAQMAAYNQFGDNKFGVEAYKSYGRAIGMMKDLVNCEMDVTDDKIIATVLLFCTFKEISGEGHGDPNEHAPGLFYLLEKRGPGQIGTRTGAELFFLSLLRLQIYSFLHDDITYTDPGAIATVLGLFDPLLRALSMMSKTLALRQAMSKQIALETYSHTNIPAETPQNDGGEEDAPIIEKCVEMLNEFYVWDTEAAAYWQSTFEGRAVPTTLGEVVSGTTYYDAETACTIILVRSARLILLISILLYNGTMELIGKEMPGNSDAWIEFIPFLKSDVGKTIDDILASVPYALGDVDPNGQPTSMQHDGASAVVIVNSIKLVMYCAYITPEQLQKAKNILMRLNTVIGIKSATGWAENEPVPKWAEEQNLLRSLDFTVAL